MFNPNASQSPVNPLPPAIVGLALIIAVVEIVFQLGANGLIGGPSAVGWRIQAIQTFGFFDGVFEYMRQTGTYDLNTVMRFFTYSFVHLALTHAIFAIVLILAIGKAVGEIFHPASVIAIFFLSAFTGSLAYGVFFDSPVQMTGSFPAVYGLLGAYTWMLWLKAGATGVSRLKAFKLAGLLFGFQLAYQMFFLIGYDQPFSATAYQWVGRSGGFITGFLLSFVLAPDGRQRVLGWVVSLRKR